MSGWRGDGDGWEDAQSETDPDAWARAYREAREQESWEAQEIEDAELQAQAEETAERDRVRSRRRRSLITFLVVLLVLFLGFWYAYSYIRTEQPTATPSPTACVPVDTGAVRPADVTLNVYNATGRSGLAALTSEEAVTLGFIAGAVANDPLGKTIEGPAEVRYGPQGKQAGGLVLAMVGAGAVPVEDTREDSTVDLVLGQTFNTLGAVPSPGLPVCPPASPSPSASPSAS